VRQARSWRRAPGRSLDRRQGRDGSGIRPAAHRNRGPAPALRAGAEGRPPRPRIAFAGHLRASLPWGWVDADPGGARGRSRHRGGRRGPRAREGAGSRRPQRRAPGDRRAGLPHTAARAPRRPGGAGGGGDALRAVGGPAGSAGGDRGRHRRAPRRRPRPRPDRRDRRRQGGPLLHHPGDGRTRRRGPAARPRLPDLRLGRALRWRRAGFGAAARGARLPHAGGRCRRSADAPHAPADPEFARQSDGPRSPSAATSGS
jgi:hypothetical protein